MLIHSLVIYEQTSTHQITIIIADDHIFFRDGLKKIIALNDKFKLVAEAGDGVELVEKATLFKPELLLVDISMPNMNGIDAIIQLKKDGSTAKVIAISMRSETSIINKMKSAGANGYLYKNTSKDELFEAINEVVLAGHEFFPEIKE